MNFRRGKCFLLYEASWKFWLIMHCILDIFITPTVSVTSRISTSKRMYSGISEQSVLTPQQMLLVLLQPLLSLPTPLFFPFLLLFSSSPKTHPSLVRFPFLSHHLIFWAPYAGISCVNQWDRSLSPGVINSEFNCTHYTDFTIESFIPSGFLQSS